MDLFVIFLKPANSLICNTMFPLKDKNLTKPTMPDTLSMVPDRISPVLNLLWSDSRRVSLVQISTPIHWLLITG